MYESENSALVSSDSHEGQFDVENHEENEKCGKAEVQECVYDSNDDIRSEYLALSSSDNDEVDEDEHEPADHKPRTITAEDRLRSEEAVAWLWFDHAERHVEKYKKWKLREIEEDIKTKKKMLDLLYKWVERCHVDKIKNEITQREEREAIDWVENYFHKIEEKVASKDAELRLKAEREMEHFNETKLLCILNRILIDQDVRSIQNDSEDTELPLKAEREIEINGHINVSLQLDDAHTHRFHRRAASTTDSEDSRSGTSPRRPSAR